MIGKMEFCTCHFPDTYFIIFQLFFLCFATFFQVGGSRILGKNWNSVNVGNHVHRSVYLSLIKNNKRKNSRSASIEPGREVSICKYSRFQALPSLPSFLTQENPALEKSGANAITYYVSLWIFNLSGVIYVFNLDHDLV